MLQYWSHMADFWKKEHHPPLAGNHLQVWGMEHTGLEAAVNHLAAGPCDMCIALVPRGTATFLSQTITLITTCPQAAWITFHVALCTVPRGHDPW